MNKEELLYRSDLYKENIEAWELFSLVYNGGKPLVEHALYQHERETYTNYLLRLKDGYSFNYAKAIINLLHQCVSNKDPIRRIGRLEGDRQWDMFTKDSDLCNTNYDRLLNNSQKMASICGAIGFLVNKPTSKLTVGQEIEAGVYPYVATYTLPNIFDWSFKRDPITHRRYLDYLKLRESADMFLIWRPDSWEEWRLERNQKPERVAAGENTLGEIPFLWMQNVERISNEKYLGISDIDEIAYIELALVNNLSCIQEGMKLAGFPMMRKPMRRAGQEETSDETGPRAVQEFDPTLGEAGKADWMESPIRETVESGLKLINSMADEIYRIANLSTVNGQRKSNKSVSAVGIRFEAEQLNQILNLKCDNICEADLGIIRLWLKWQDKIEMFDEIESERSREFNTDELSVQLDNEIVGMKHLYSKTARSKVQQKIANHLLPNMSDAEKDTIAQETEANTPETIVMDMTVDTGGQHMVRGGLEAH